MFNLSLPQSTFDGIRAMASSAGQGILDALQKINKVNALKDAGSGLDGVKTMIEDIKTDKDSISISINDLASPFVLGSGNESTLVADIDSIRDKIATALNHIALTTDNLRAVKESVAGQNTQSDTNLTDAMVELGTIELGFSDASAALVEVKIKFEDDVDTGTPIVQSDIGSGLDNVKLLLDDLDVSFAKLLSDLGAGTKVVGMLTPKVDTSAAMAMINNATMAANIPPPAALGVAATTAAAKDSGGFNSLINSLKNPTDYTAVVLLRQNKR